MLNHTSMKRISNELKRDFKNMDYSLTMYHPNKRYMEVKIPISDNTMVFRIFPDYPFKPPNLFINDINYMVYFNRIYMLNENVVKRFYIYASCPCCDTILCNWSPGDTLYNLVEEYLIRVNKYKNIKTILSFNIVKPQLPFDELVYNTILKYIYQPCM